MNLFQLRSCRLYTQKPIQSDFPAHIHHEYELFCFLAGDAAYSVEGNIYPLSPGDILLLKVAETHSLLLKSDMPCKRITIHFKPTDDMPIDILATFKTAVVDRPIGYYNLYSSTSFDTSRWLYYIDRICDETDTMRQQVYLLVLLQELASNFALLLERDQNMDSDIVIKITHYIERHLSDHLTLDAVCKRFFISESQLTRVFKKTLGVTVGEYILTKRLVYAHNLIKEGTKPTAAHVQCGFNDYSSFYRSYKKRFGYSPKITNSNLAIEESILLERPFEI